MNTIVNCPACGFRGRLPAGLAALKTVVCPKCRASVAVDGVRRAATAEDDSFPIWVDDGAAPAPDAAITPARTEEPMYAGDYMKEEAERFAQYVAARLAELHKRRHELADAECRFEALTMDRKQHLHRHQAAQTATTDELARREADVQAKEGAFAPREAELAGREARVARAESRAANVDRRAAELRATLDQIETRRAALADERAALDRRAEALDRAELALHRRTAELDEIDERVRQEQEEWEQTHDRAG